MCAVPVFLTAQFHSYTSLSQSGGERGGGAANERHRQKKAKRQGQRQIQNTGRTFRAESGREREQQKKIENELFIKLSTAFRV